ncbi:heavy metal translocating P-type ATPase [Altererythrobacter litoralis]|uniref:Heavy metal translocating P-type ATPase n=1 Tax=Altererythrobacter litoralis TaxID=3113904 RepID=A0ABU7GDU7_9SPHN|nr:heavy metal translocating P-type ATPase [Erythrobacteraceae bacterium 1XM1-14]
MNAPHSFPEADRGELVDSRFTVPGMRCAGCIAKLERELPKVEGIAEARVNFSAKRVALRHDPDLAEEQLIEAIEALGFEVQRLEDNPLGRDDADRRMLLRATAVAGFGMMNVMLLSVSVWSGAGGVTKQLFHWLSAIIAIPVIAYSGRPFFASAWMALRHGRTNMDVPISIGVLLATALSFYETATGGVHAYFDSAVMLLFFLLCGRALDAMMRGRTRAGIDSLLGRMGKSATVLAEDGSTSRVSAEDIRPGMVMLVAAGEALAADGEVIDGSSAIDNSMLTGESRLEPVGLGAEVHAGTINVMAPIRVRATAVANDTRIAEIARLMDEAGQSRSRYVRIADRASRTYAPAVHTLALLAFIGWMLAGVGWHQSLLIAIAVLIITCPCALGLAVPAAQVVASNTLIKQGLLVKDGTALERLAEVDCVRFDKTGTLTLGEPRPDLSTLDDEAKPIALGLAQNSRHPLSKGLAKALLAQGVIPASLTDVTERPGEGIFAMSGTTPVALARASETSEHPMSEIRIGDRRQLIHFADPLREDIAETLHELEALGLETELLSGDRKDAVEAVGKKFGLASSAGLSPADKLDLLNGLKSQGCHPLMVGDGLNDGPALAAAHAAIAPGTASDASQQAADAVFIGERLIPVAKAVQVAKATMRVVRQNFVLAIGYNVLAVPLALAGLVTPLIAAIAMSISSVIVVGNSLRLAGAAK